MAFLTPELAAHLAAHHGVVDLCTLLRHGVTLHELDTHRRRGTFVRIHTGVFRVATAPDTFEARCHAACLADAELVLCGPSAARWWKFKHTGTPDLVHAIVAHDRTPVSTGVVLRRSNELPATDVVEMSPGIRVTSPARTWFDRARDMNDHYFEALTEHVLRQHCTMPTLWAKLATAYDGQDRWYLEALGIGSDVRPEACFEAYLDAVSGRWDTAAGRDLVWRVRAPKAADAMVSLIADPNRPLRETDRYFRSLEFHGSEVRSAALKRLLP